MNDCDAIRRDKQVATVMRAEREEIPVETTVIEGLEASGSASEHASFGGNVHSGNGAS
jgi:hypothetical protein